MQAIQAMTAKVGRRLARAGARGARHAQRARRRRRLVCRDRAAAVRGRASIASCRRRSADLHPRWHTPHVALLVQAAIAGVFVVPRPGRHVGARRLRRARQHEHHRVLHPVPVHVRGDDQAAARAGRPGRDARAGRPAGRHRSWRRSDSSSPRSSIVLACVPAGRRAEQDAGRREDGRLVGRARWRSCAVGVSAGPTAEGAYFDGE